MHVIAGGLATAFSGKAQSGDHFSTILNGVVWVFIDQHQIKAQRLGKSSDRGDSQLARTNSQPSRGAEPTPKFNSDRDIALSKMAG